MKPSTAQLIHSNRDRRPSQDLKLQDVFLNYCRREKIAISMRLVDQSKKNGLIIGFDSQTVILDTDGHQSLNYKTAIISIDPVEPFDYIFNDAHRFDDGLIS